MNEEKDCLTLAIESSCDETSAAVLRGGRTVLANIISTQIPVHQKFGGVVPEIASRKHIVNIMPVIDEALRQADVKLADIDQIGVTYGPGLVGALLVGVSAAKALAHSARPVSSMSARTLRQPSFTLFIPVPVIKGYLPSSRRCRLPLYAGWTPRRARRLLPAR